MNHQYDHLARFIILSSLLFLCACAQQTQTPVPVDQSASPPPLETPISSATASPLSGYPAPQGDTLPAGYPAPLTPSAPDLSISPTLAPYPGPDYELTNTVVALTLTARPTSTPTTVPPTPIPTPTRGPLANPLPAPLYMAVRNYPLDPRGFQIWRLERDGYTFTQVTQEEKDVGAFDISSDGRLAYISDNSLVVSGPRGENRRVLVAGIPWTAPQNEEQGQWYIDKEQVDNPHWSPDGRKLAYSKDGVNLLDLSSGKTIKVVPGRKWSVNAEGHLALEGNRFTPLYFPHDWTPDGKRMILRALSYEECSAKLVAPVADAPLISLDIRSAGCWDYSFTRSGEMLFSDGDHMEIGLWRVDTTTGKAQALTEPFSAPGDAWPIVQNPFQAPDGRIFFFTTRNGRAAEEPTFLLAYVDGKKFPFRVPEDITFVNQSFYPDVALWLPDASRVIVSYNGNQLYILDTATSQITPLGIAGTGLKWGPGAKKY